MCPVPWRVQSCPVSPVAIMKESELLCDKMFHPSYCRWGSRYWHWWRLSWLQVILSDLKYEVRSSLWLATAFDWPQPLIGHSFWLATASDWLMFPGKGPALVAHPQSGRLFAVNAHLKPGQLLRSGGIFWWDFKYYFNMHLITQYTKG